jgi:hypothetical protein
MVDNAGTNHIQIDVYQTSQQMFTIFDGGGMVSISLQKATESSADGPI